MFKQEDPAWQFMKGRLGVLEDSGKSFSTAPSKLKHHSFLRYDWTKLKPRNMLL